MRHAIDGDADPTMSISISDGVCLALELFREFLFQLLIDFFFRHILQKPLDVFRSISIVIAFILAVLINTAGTSTGDVVRNMCCDPLRFLSDHTLNLSADCTHLAGVRRECAVAGNCRGLDGEVRCRLRQLTGKILFHSLLTLLCSIIFLISRLSGSRIASRAGST